MKGIDISSYQGNIDFKAVKDDGVEIVILKATEGKTWKDNMFNTYYNQAKEQGLKIGAYHFLRNNETEEEINNFLSVIKDKPMDIKLVIDSEVDLGGTAHTSKKVRDFADTLLNKGYEICLYTGEYFYRDNLDKTVKDIPLWVAKYSSSSPNCKYIGWQYTEKGKINGINTAVDVNNFTEDILCGRNSEKKPEINKFNDAVKELQHKINIMKIFMLDEDGIYGDNTRQAIKTFQCLMGLDKDGICGDKTYTAINQIFDKHLIKEGSSYIYANKYIQYKLGTEIDGIIGRKSKNLIISFQKKCGLDADGIVGDKTWANLLK